jgi:DNA-binding transcriptional MerR regulator
MALTVGELARLTGVTVRTLHHYDERGLVTPSQRSAAGHRLYDDDDVLRLQQVLLLRELGLPLDDIAAAIDGPATPADRAALLRQHRGALADKRGRLDRMLAAVDAAIAAHERGEPPMTTSQKMTNDDLKQLFDGFDPAEHEEEVQARWGDTDAYRESARRTKGYGKAEWEQLKRESESIYSRLAALMRAGTPPADPAAQALVDEARGHIDRWFYPCSRAMHRQLGAMYVADPRFAENLDKIAPGFARYLSDAIAAS